MVRLLNTQFRSETRYDLSREGDLANKSANKAGIFFTRNRNTRDDLRPCVCLMPGCGRVCELLTNVHAQQHGYRDKFEMIKAGMIKFIDYPTKRAVISAGQADYTEKNTKINGM